MFADVLEVSRLVWEDLGWMLSQLAFRGCGFSGFWVLGSRIQLCCDDQQVSWGVYGTSENRLPEAKST